MQYKSLKKRIAIIGTQGYSGLTLASYLLDHPQVELATVFARQDDWQLGHDLIHPKAQSVPTFSMEDFPQHLSSLDVVFLATPANVSIEWVPICLAAGVLTIDLSGGFRLPEAAHPEWYGFTHQAPGFLDEAHYGLSPWQSAKPTQLIANPGCYATAALMAVLPVVPLMHVDSLILDGKSGVTGAGRSAKRHMLFAEVAGDFYPYKVGRHQHTPEITHAIAGVTGQTVAPKLTTQILPTQQGIAMTAYARLKAGVTAQDVEQAFTQAYQDYPLVTQMPLLQAEQQEPQLLHLKSVVGTPMTHLVYTVDAHGVQVFCFIDNLHKGAASQAIENLNRYYDWPVSLGLLPGEVV